MNLVRIIIVILVVVILAGIISKIILRKKLNDIDGFNGTHKRGGNEDGNIIGDFGDSE